MGSRTFGESLLSLFVGLPEDRSAILNAAAHRLSIRSPGESLAPRLFGRAEAHPAFSNAPALRLSSRYSGVYLVSGFPGRSVLGSPTSRDLTGRASSFCNNCLIRSILRKLTGQPRGPGCASGENICALIRQAMFARGGRPVGPPLDCGRSRPFVVEFVGAAWRDYELCVYDSPRTIHLHRKWQ